MIQMFEEQVLNQPTEQTIPSGAAQSAVSIVRILTLLLVVGFIGGIGFFAMQIFSGPPAKYAFRGQVLYNGQPVTTGAVMTQLQGNPIDIALGPLDEDGRFELSSNGEPGISEGVHKLAVSSMASGMPPRPLVPSEYLEIRTTPLQITVTSDPAANTIVLELEGELSNPAPLAGPPGGGPPAAAPAEADGESDSTDSSENSLPAEEAPAGSKDQQEPEAQQTDSTTDNE
jgi:nitrate reductase NapE component